MRSLSFYNYILPLVALSSLVAAAPLVDERHQRRQQPPQLRGGQDLLGVTGQPIDKSQTATVDNYDLAPGQQEDADLGFYFDFTKVKNPQPMRGNYRYDAINSDLFTPPGTDSGDVPNAKWPMGLSHNRNGLVGAGWARQQNDAVLPEATAMAGVNMHLSPNAYRELHWHKAGEWSLILNGSVRLTAVNEDGQSFVDDLNAGDVWFFPPGIPHSIQAFDEGTEFLLVFDDGDFSEEGTFLATEMMLRNPTSVLAKNFQTDVSAFDNLYDDQLWIFPGTPPPSDIEQQNITGPAGFLPNNESYSYHFSQQEPYEVPGGSVKIIDPSSFPIASMFSAALVTIKPGAMREMHWHLDSDEWSFFISGSGRVTLYSAPESSRTFDFQGGDVAYIPVPMSHYIENVGDEDLVFLEVLQSPKFTDMSVSQWIALTPPQVFKDTLNLTDDVIARQPKQKTLLKPGSTNLTETDFTPKS
ncbi:MAG: hypothetical protein Q9227_003380 [Pyrenula ochraceoflavens]